MKKECIAMLLAGGQGSRLYVLTGDMAKPAVPFGGKYRIIDFPLSNCTNSGIDTVGVLTQYQPLELNSYIGSGAALGPGPVHTAASTSCRPTWAARAAPGTRAPPTPSIRTSGFIDLYDPEYVLILSGDHIYKMDYSKMVERHKAVGAACTISVMEVPVVGGLPLRHHERGRERPHLRSSQEKPKEPKSNLASMGIYVFTWKTLRRYLDG